MKLAAVLCLALVAVAAATIPAAEPKPKPKPTCQVPNEVDACFQQIQECNKDNKGKLFSPPCCNQLAEQLGCGCLLRDALLKAGLFDIQAPFCVAGTGCEMNQ